MTHYRPAIQFCPKGHNTFLKGRTIDRHCKDCKLAQSKVYKRTNGYAIAKKSWREHNWRNYGVKNESGEPFTILDYDRFYQIQSGRCKNHACSKHQSELKGALVVDHDHLTGIARGLLCRRCNMALGLLEDKNNLLVGLSRYLKK